ncbi:MAG: CPBP family glutamic-type intramembrane protease [Thermoplasmatota archaeon]
MRRGAVLAVFCSLAGALTYLCASLGLRALGISRGAHELSVFIGFFLAPLLLIFSSGGRAELGGLDRGFLEGVGTYLLLLAPVLPLMQSRRDFFESYVMGAGDAALWALLTLLQVSTVDFFTRRVIQLEVERAWGACWGIAAGFAAWGAGHLLEYGWLSGLMTPPGAVIYLGVSGALTGLVYWRRRNVAGLAAGHFLINLVVAACSAALLGGG